MPQPNVRRFRFIDLSDSPEQPSSILSLPLRFLDEVDELRPFLKASPDFWVTRLTPIMEGIQADRDMTKEANEFYARGHRLFHSLLGGGGTCERVNNLLENTFRFWVKAYRWMSDVSFAADFLGKRAMVVTYRQWQIQIADGFESGSNRNELLETLAVEAFDQQENWTEEQRGSLSHFIGLFTDMIHYYQLTHPEHHDDNSRSLVDTAFHTLPASMQQVLLN